MYIFPIPLVAFLDVGTRLEFASGKRRIPVTLALEMVGMGWSSNSEELVGLLGIAALVPMMGVELIEVWPPILVLVKAAGSLTFTVLVLMVGAELEMLWSPDPVEPVRLLRFLVPDSISGLGLPGERDKSLLADMKLLAGGYV